MVARVYGAPRAAGPWSGFVCVISHAPNENAFVLRRVRHRAPRALTLRLLRPLGVVVLRLSVGCIMMPEVGSSLRLLAKLARAAGRAARARAVGAGERAPPARVSGRAVTRWRRSGVRRHAGAVERAVRARGERREPPRFGTCEQPRGSRRPDERGRARRRRRIGRGRRAGGPRVGAEEREGFVGARSRSVGRARSSLVERHERVAPTRGERAGAGKGERASPRGVPGRARARAEHEVEEERNRGIYDLARARSARIVRAGTSARGLPRERVSARREGRGIARSRARASALARPRERSLGARAEKKRDMRGVGAGGAGAMSRCREGARAGGARGVARAASLWARALSCALLGSARGARFFCQVGGRRGRHIDTSRYHYVCLRLRFHSKLVRYSTHLKRTARLLRARGVARAQKGCLAICTLR
jgi:hypothetical protein